MSSAAETIKERLGIVEVVSSYIKIDKAGAHYKGRCPFHNEKTPSFFVSPARNNYYCFGCGAKGDVFTFVQEFEKVDFVGALKILADRAGIELEQFKDERKGEFDRLRSVMEMSLVYYEGQLKKNPKALQYLKDRGLTDKTITEWRIGYADNEWRKVHDMLVSKKVTQDEMEKVGLVKKSDQEHSKDRVYDRFRARIMFPLFDPSSRVIAYSGRIFGVPDTDGPKYLNSPDTPLFNKSETLYGYHKAKDGIRQWKYAILVEGQMDLLMCHQSGFTNAVATSGTSLTHAHLEKLKRLSDNLMLVYDADKAGLKATLRAWVSASALLMDVKVASLPKGEDPASILLKDKEQFKEAIKHSKHIIEYYVDSLLKENVPEAQFKKAIEREVLPYIAVVDSAIERSNFISKVSVKTGLYESDIREEIEKIRSNPDFKNKLLEEGNKTQSQKTEDVSEMGHTISYTKQHYRIGDNTLRRISALYIWLQSPSQTHPQKVSMLQKIDEAVARILSNEEREIFKKYIEDAPQELVFEAEILFEGSKKIEIEVQDVLYELEERVLKERLSKSMQELSLAEKKKDTQKIEELIKTCNEISLKLSELNKKKSG